MKNRTDQILLIAFVLTLAAYLVMFAACFSQFPISASPLLQFFSYLKCQSKNIVLFSSAIII